MQGCNTRNKADACMEKILLLGDLKYIFAENRNCINDFCQ